MSLYENTNIKRLYLKTLGSGQRIVSIMGTESKVGSTTLAIALAQRHLLAKHSVLYVELNSISPNMYALCDITHNTQQTQNQVPMLISSNDSEEVITGILAPQDKNDILTLSNPILLKNYLDKVSNGFDAIIIDCAPLCASQDSDDIELTIPADMVAAVSDGIILVLKGGATKIPILKKALSLIQLHGKKPTAIAINQQTNPTLGQELIRECMRMQQYFPKLSKWLCSKLKESGLMQPL